MTATSPGGFKVGDRVTITRSHAHAGKSGSITRRSDVPGHDWVVQLDGAFEPSCYAPAYHLRRA